MNDITRITQAVQFAAKVHTQQKRKGKQEEPYVIHLADVAALVADATQGSDANLVIAAYLHDTIEDGAKYGYPVSRQDLADKFGEDVADLVNEVTDDKNLPKQRRKELQVEHAAHASIRAKTLKLADKISNLRAISNPETAPSDWSPDRKREYFDWAKRVVDNCRGANAALETIFDDLYACRGKLG